MRWLIVSAALVVCLATGVAITSLEARADDARVTQAVLSDIRAELSEQRALEWEARATGRAGAEILEANRALRTRMRREVGTLARVHAHPSHLAHLQEHLAAYQSAVDDMFGFLARGNLELATQVDKRRVDPAYDRLADYLAGHRRTEGAEAVKILQRSKAGILLSVGGALFALLALLWHYHRTAQRSGREQARRLAHEATHDYLTGLPNRRRLMDDLDQPSTRRLLAFFDLDGFKSYNDTFGHVEGDLLLQRLSRKLARVVETRGVAYRVGGDEFCVVAPLSGDDDGIALLVGCVEALSEMGEGFDVRTSWGSVRLPDEASNGAAALVLADQRMYAHKGSDRTSAGKQTRDLVLRVLAERHPALREHVGEVAALALATGERLGLGDTDLREIERAAELHDIGKIAIPDAILDKSGPLDEEEWRFMRRHTLIGEAMLSAAPALTSVARIVRSSHERFDGGGYPDALTGHAIPLASRIVFVCDAFHAMTSERTYGSVMSVEQALAELSRCAGTQFDPQVVTAFRAARFIPPPPLVTA